MLADDHGVLLEMGLDFASWPLPAQRRGPSSSYVEGAWATGQRRAWQVSIGGCIVFAHQSDGCAQALQAAAHTGDQVSVATRRIRADLWADAVHRRG